MIKENIKIVSKSFDDNIESVFDLMKFDELVQGIGLKSLQTAKDALEKFSPNSPKLQTINNQYKILKDIRQHDSLAIHYQKMFNQCIVLLVSYFASAVEDLFIISLSHKLKNFSQAIKSKDKDDIKITIGELIDLNFDLSPKKVAELLVKRKEINFQDMKSIFREFNNYFDFEIPKDLNTNNIILAQHCRHVLVHSAGIMNKKALDQIKDADPRSIKTNLREDDEINFTEDEIKIVANSMKVYFSNVVDQCISALALI
ncbi:MAG: hypothetical protein LLF92_10335 [Planctomycetaceae bacterium]|nr:hypothetical protein [Planctomycetaceae bacterium]